MVAHFNFVQATPVAMLRFNFARFECGMFCAEMLCGVSCVGAVRERPSTISNVKKNPQNA
jgi:hypothetical protein